MAKEKIKNFWEENGWKLALIAGSSVIFIALAIRLGWDTKNRAQRTFNQMLSVPADDTNITDNVIANSVKNNAVQNER